MVVTPAKFRAHRISGGDDRRCPALEVLCRQLVRRRRNAYRPDRTTRAETMEASPVSGARDPDSERDSCVLLSCPCRSPDTSFEICPIVYILFSPLSTQAIGSPLSRFFRDNLSRILARPPKTLGEKYFCRSREASWTFFPRRPNLAEAPFSAGFQACAQRPPDALGFRVRPLPARSPQPALLRTRQASAACRPPSGACADAR